MSSNIVCIVTSVHLKRARCRLVAKDRSGKSDPFCEIRLLIGGEFVMYRVRWTVVLACKSAVCQLVCDVAASALLVAGSSGKIVGVCSALVHTRLRRETTQHTTRL